MLSDSLLLFTISLNYLVEGIQLHRGTFGSFEFTVNRTTISRNDTFAIELDLSEQNHIPDSAWYQLRNSGHDTILTVNDDHVSHQIIVVPNQLVTQARPLFRTSPNWQVGLSPRSLFVEMFGPVSVLLDADDCMEAELRLNTTVNSFREECFDGNTITFPLSAFGDESTRSEVVFDIEAPTNSSYVPVTFSEEISQFRLSVKPLPAEVVLVVPVEIFEFVRCILIEEGAEEVSTEDIYNNCDTSILEHLPDIILHISFPDHELSSRLVIGPLDYMFFYSEYSACRIGLLPAVAWNNEAVIDLMQLTGINLHISPNGIEICDSNVEILV